jgi:DNA-binding response OmpR family regulator
MNNHKPTILIVEDEVEMIKSIAIYLGDKYKIFPAYTGKEALEIFEKIKADLILLDILIPEVSGIDVLRAIRKKNRKVGIIMLTALDKAEPAIESLQLGANDYITKPFEAKELSKKIKSVLKEIKFSTIAKDNRKNCLY